MFGPLLTVILLSIGYVMPVASQAAPHTDEAGRWVLQYASALTHSQVGTWAAADLGCLSRGGQRIRGQAPHLPAELAQQCWDETLKAHAALVAQQAEAGVFSATGRGHGLGLLHERHRASEMWKDYPPAVFLSPPVILRDQAPIDRKSVV